MRPGPLIDRKEVIFDLIASIKDGRYEEQSYRLLHSSNFPLHSIIYLIEGMFSQVNNQLEKKMIYSAMTSLHYFKGFSVYRTAHLKETADWLLNMIDKIEKEFNKGRVPYYLTNPFLKQFQKREEENLSENQEKIPQNQENYCSVVKKVRQRNTR